MRILYYMPFKPMGHDQPSGDLIIGTELYRFLRDRGHRIRSAGRLRTRWIYLQPWRWPGCVVSLVIAMTRAIRSRGDVWLTYHSYYKAPDILGPLCARAAKIPYVIFQGIYATKRRRRMRTWAGFMFNRWALRAADVVLTNKRRDYDNLLRIIPSQRLVYVRPGIVCRDFIFDAEARRELRERWGWDPRLPVVVSAAMFRPGVKTRGAELVIRTCARLMATGLDFNLVLAGDGVQRQRLEALAHGLMPGRFRFAGRIQRSELYRFYSAGDVFAFPGIDESLGMVYLEAQSCGLPAVAFEDWGAREAILHGKTGLLSPAADPAAFGAHIRLLLEDKALRQTMGKAAAAHIREHHDLYANYLSVEKILECAITANR